MKYFNWNSDKNEILKRERGISFEENPGYPNQRMYVLEIENYAIIVPYVENDKAIEEGIPYQTLISSIVHKYLNGSLTPKS